MSQAEDDDRPESERSGTTADIWSRCQRPLAAGWARAGSVVKAFQHMASRTWRSALTHPILLGLAAIATIIGVLISAIALVKPSSEGDNVRIDAGSGNEQNYYGPVVNYYGSGPAESQPSTSAAAPASTESRACRDEGVDDTSPGWGPAREPLLAANQYSAEPTLNLTDIPPWGDTRWFLGVRDSDAPPSATWDYSIKVERGHTYVLKAVVYNSASPEPGDAVQGTRVSAAIPTCSGRWVPLNVFLEATNTTTDEIWDGIAFYSDEIFNLAYVDGTARWCTSARPCGPELSTGFTLSRDLFTSRGELLGSDVLDGNLLGGVDNGGYVLFTVEPQFAPRQ